MDVPLGAKLAILGFCVLLIGTLFLYHYLEDRARRRKLTSKEPLNPKAGPAAGREAATVDESEPGVRPAREARRSPGGSL